MLASLRPKLLARHFAADRRAVSAVEFALLLPLLLCLLLGGIEVGQAVTIYRKLSHTGSALGDLVAQVSTIDTTELSNVFDAAKAIMSPYDSTGVKMIISAVSYNGSTTKVEWSRASGTGATAWTKGGQAPITIPSSLLSTSQWTIVSKVDYTYNTPYSTLWSIGPVALADIAYLRPRVSASVTCATC